MPKRAELSELYARVMDAAKGKRVVFRTLDIGSDKVLPYMKPNDEPNPALGWRAIRVGLDKPGVMRMQLQALIRAASGRPLTVMFPFVAQCEEFTPAAPRWTRRWSASASWATRCPKASRWARCWKRPSLAFAPDSFSEVDFLSIGGNDLKQFFFAADRENERVRRRYDTLNVSFLTFLEGIVRALHATDTPLSFCGEDAGRPVEAACLAAIGLRSLSMRPASIGPVKSILRRTDLVELQRRDPRRAQAAGCNRCAPP